MNKKMNFFCLNNNFIANFTDLKIIIVKKINMFTYVTKTT
jgi:hypothetical protein